MMASLDHAPGVLPVWLHAVGLPPVTELVNPEVLFPGTVARSTPQGSVSHGVLGPFR